MRIKPCAGERENLFIYENKITFDVLPLKKCLANFNPTLKLCITLLTKNNICLFDSQMPTFHKTGVAAFPSLC